MTQTRKTFSKLFSTSGLVSALIGIAISDAQALPDFYLPFPAGSQYSVTQGWTSGGSHSDYYNKYAVDFGMSIGQPVAATASGRVIRSSRGKTNIASGCDRRFINNAHYVVIDHGENVSSLYLHLSEVNVSVDDTVSQGQILGKSGNTGWVCGPHLHFSFQKTNTTDTYAGESIGIGFVETERGAPRSGATYASRNSAIPSIATVVSKATGKALDAGGANGNEIYPHPSPNPGNVYHRWRLSQVGDAYLIVSEATGKALDAGGADGNQIYPHPSPNSGNVYHLWKLEKVGDAYLITSKATGKALDAGGADGNQIYPHPSPNSGNVYHLWRVN